MAMPPTAGVAAPAEPRPLLRGEMTGAECGRCPFSKLGKPNRPVVGEGPSDPQFVVIGEGPGSNEVALGRPFVGASGQIVNKMLTLTNVRRDSVWITNATLCQPTAGASDTTKREAREACAGRLTRELRRVPGRPILALGNVAMQACLGDGHSITSLAGSYHNVDVDGTGPRHVIPTIHPAAIIRGGSGVAGAHAPDLAFWNLVYDTSKIVALAAGRDILFREDIETEWESGARAESLIRRMVADVRRVKFVAIDTETYVEDEKRHSALQPLNAKLRAIGLATAEWGLSVAWHVMNPISRRLVGAVLADQTVRKVMHNRLYDRPVLARHGLPVFGANDDTLLLHHNAFPGLAHDLQRVSTQFYAIPPWKAEFRAGDDALPELTRYNALDTLATARLHAPLQIAVKKTNAERTYEIDLKMAEIAEVMHIRGVPISREVNDGLYRTFAANMAQAKRIIEEKATDPEVQGRLWDRLAFEQAKRRRKNDPDDFEERKTVRIDEIRKAWENGKWKWSIASSDHIVAYLKARGVPLYFQTPSGKTATGKDILEQFAHLPEVRAILDYRENGKMFSTFVASMFDRYDANGKIIRYGYADKGNRIHPRWSVHKITGRWGAEDPMAQNWPKADKKKGRPNLRSQVVAPKGRKLVGFDFAQLEARIIALMSGDPFLVDIFVHGKDIHSEFARIVWPNFDQLPIDERKKLRDTVKRPEYGAFYGGQIETLWKNVVKDYPQIKLSDIARMVQLMTEKMPGVARWHNDLLRAAAKPPHEIRSAILGRRRCFPLGNADVNDVYNFPVQSGGADLMNIGMSRIWPRLVKYRDAFPILQIHDAAIFECDEDDAPKIAEDIVECFTQEHTINGVTIQFPVEPDIGDSWAEV